MTVQETVQKAIDKLTHAGVATPRLDAEVLLSHVVNKDRAWVFTHGGDVLDGPSVTLFDEAVGRRARREPLQYILGRQEFWGLDFTVTPDVLIPRPETELVVETALKAFGAAGTPATVIDLCTGSGCIAVSVAKECASARVFATDKSEKALAVARVNARRHEVSERIRFFEGDLFSPLGELALYGRADVVTANPPYIPSGDLPGLQPEVKEYEPELALIAGPEGLELERRIIEEAPEFLKKKGLLVMEMGMGQAQALLGITFESGAYEQAEILKDLAGLDRVIAARKR